MSKLAERVAESPELLHRLIDAAESCAVNLKDLSNNWPVRELHVRPAESLAQLRTALGDLGVAPEELTAVFGEG